MKTRSTPKLPVTACWSGPATSGVRLRGVFAWLPLGLRVKAKIEAVIRAEMQGAGAQEVLFPALLPREPFEATGRWDDYGDALFRLQDRRGDDYLLAPTHEEAFTLLVKDIVASHRDLPVTIYQIQEKFRDEARPRAGLLRGREFTMKDAYSFDISDDGLAESYRRQRDAYERIFTMASMCWPKVARSSNCSCRICFTRAMSTQSSRYRHQIPIVPAGHP